MKFDYLLNRYFGLGNIPFAPGTVTSFFILILWYFVPNIFSVQLSIILLHLFLGFYFCYKFNPTYEHIDPSYIVIDEVTGMMISLFLLPKSIFLYCLAFLLFRFLDIFKPSIIDRLQNFGYGIGIMLDDIAAGLITLLTILCISM